MLTKKVSYLLILLISITLLISGCSDNPTGNIVGEGNLTGQIVEPLGENPPRPASGLVTLEGDNIYKVYGDANWGAEKINDGTFSKTGLKEGSYSLTVRKLGYESVTKNITVEEGQSTDLGSIEVSLKNNFTSDGFIYYATTPSITPFDDLAVRRALTYAIDWNTYETFLDIPNSKAKKLANRIITPNTTGYIEEKITNNYDLQKAETILEQAGYTTGELDLTISILDRPLFVNIANELISYWGKIEQINSVSKEKYSYDTFRNKYVNDELGLYIYGWNMDNPDPVFLLDYFANHHLNNAEVDNLIKKAKMNINDKQKTLNYLYDIEEKVISDGLIYPLHYFE